MVYAYKAITNTDKTVILPSAISVLNQLLSILNLDYDMRLRITNMDSELVNGNWNIGSMESIDDSGPIDKLIEVNVDTNNNSDRALMSIPSPATKPFIYDEETNLFSSVQYMDTEINLELEFKSKSKSECQNMLNRLRLMNSRSQSENMHSFTAAYNVPIEVGILIQEVLDKRNINSDVVMTVDEYLNHIETNNLTFTTNLSGTERKLAMAIKETQGKIIGTFTSDINDIKIKQDKNNIYYSVPLSYKYNINMPTNVHMGYEFVVFNSLLSKNFLPRTQEHIEYNAKYIYDNNIYKFSNKSQIEDLLSKLDPKAECVNIPSFDHFTPVNTPTFIYRIFTVLTGITKEDRRNLFNLTDIPGIKIKDEIIEFLKHGEYDHITFPLGSVFNLELYANTEKINYEILKVDADLNVFTTEDLDISKTFRVVFNVVADLTVLNYNTAIRLDKTLDELDSKIIEYVGQTYYLYGDNIEYNYNTNKIPKTVQVAVIASMFLE